MAITIDWGQRIINVPRNDMTLIQSSPTEIRELNLNVFRMALKDLEDGEEGQVFPDTHRHNTEVTVGGVTLARVIEIINGYTITFEDGQYAVNLTGANSNVADVTNVNQVSVRSANSAGMTSSPAIEYASFNGGVTVDVTALSVGTVYPAGTPLQPVNSLDDAKIIAEARGFSRIFVIGNITIDDDDMEGYTFVGQSIKNTKITVNPAANLVDCEFLDATIEGALDGNCVIQDSEILDLDYIEGKVQSCILSGTIELFGDARFLDCWAGGSEADPPEIDMGGAGQSLELRNYSGKIEIKNKTGSDPISIDLSSGEIVIENTVTAGTIVVRGVGKITNQGSATVDCSGLLNRDCIADSVLDEQIDEHTIEGSAGEALAGIAAIDVNILDILSDLGFIKDIEGGKWAIVGSEMIFYKADNTTEVARFTITRDGDGNPTMRTRT